MPATSTERLIAVPAFTVVPAGCVRMIGESEGVQETLVAPAIEVLKTQVASA